MNDIGRSVFEVLAQSMDLAALFTIKKRGKHFMDVTDYTGLAAEYGVPIHRVSNINDSDALEQMRALRPDYCMTLGWKQIVKPEMISVPRIGWIGCHPAWLLLKGEKPDPTVLSAPGNEPLQYAIRGRYSKTGASLFWVTPDIDAGHIFARREVPLDVEHETAATLVDKMGKAVADLLRENMGHLLSGNPPRLPQEPGEAQPYMKPIRAADLRIDLSAPAEETYALIRSVGYPYPDEFIEFHGRRIYIERARMENDLFTELKVRSGGSPYAR